MQTEPAVRVGKRVSILSGQSRSSPRSPVSRPLEAHLKAPRHPPSSPKARRHHKQFRKIRRRLFPLRSRPLRLHSHEGSVPVPGCRKARQGGRPLTQKFTPQRHQLHIYHREVPPQWEDPSAATARPNLPPASASKRSLLFGSHAQAASSGSVVID